MVMHSQRSKRKRHLGLWPVSVENVGIVCAVHHLAAGFVVFVAAAVRAVGLGSVAVACHPVAGVAHCALYYYQREISTILEEKTEM